MTRRPAVRTLGRRSNVFDETYDDTVHALIQAAQPVVQLHLRGIYDLSGEFFRWEMATTLAGWHIGINPFDQPNVEAARALSLRDAPIPGEAGSPTSSITFGVLKMAQALSDRQALLDARPSGAPSRFTWVRTCSAD